jgi:2-phospho-L-lactate guanylyltransferase
MILIPVKNLAFAKQRLAPVLDQTRRTELAHAMLEDIFDAIACAPSKPPAAVVTGDAFATALARRHGFQVIADNENAGETEAIAMATSVCQQRGAGFTLVLPGDIPLITPAEIEAILSAAPTEGTVLVPAADGRGTNAVLRSPPALFPLRFGNDSFEPHRAAAEATGKPCVILKLPGIALDVDNGADASLLLDREVTSRAQKLLRQWDIAKSWKASTRAESSGR